MEYKIIEDCSPFYIRYRHTGSDKVIEMCQEMKKKHSDTIRNKQPFMHIRLPEDSGLAILSHVYKAEQFEFLTKRVSLFVTQPGYYYRPHRDGLSIKMGINYNVDIKDSKCVTSWYDDASFAGRPIDTLNGRSREIADYNREKEKNTILPIKSMVATQGDVVLFNTELLHDFDNSNSNNDRTILTIRSRLFEKMDFFTARKILFNF